MRSYPRFLALLLVGALAPGCWPVRDEHRTEIDGRVLTEHGELAPHARVFACTSFGPRSIDEDCDEEAFTESGADGTFKFAATVGESHWVLLYGDPASPYTLLVACSEGRVGATLARGNKPLKVEVKLGEALPAETPSVGKDSYLGANVTEEDIRVVVARLCSRSGE